ncbi:ferrous iron transport protein A [Wenyingzhuangia heitensis]|uniref:Ferrous iron transport protein A n=1 Tax=Wenyingzhuangia heitensis TaxID=1487859 RepID=A0ABX0UET2_9FLAO|nr:FeoA family protein [Wenyingzhuangia heitensis]NIJ46375.1 ferrous iron transport protein A [Wenyingzhuangia heitensis]
MTKANTIADLQRGERAIIKSFTEVDVPLKLIEMGCIEGNYVEVLQRAPMQDPIYLNISGTYLAIRLEVASKILVEKL